MYRTKHSITGREYNCWDEAYDFYNARLFDGALPGAMIDYRGKANSYGHYARARYESRVPDAVTTADQIAINPDKFDGLGNAEILQTLVHEMVHQWQYHYGKPTRGGYHNEQWAVKMESIGLMPSDTGKPGGARTGQKMADYPIEGGLFATVTNELLATGFQLTWQSQAKEKKPKDNSKTKYTCNCGQAAWGKPGLMMVCALCASAFLPADNPMARPMFILQPLTEDEYRRQCEAQGLFIGGSRDLGGEAVDDDVVVETESEGAP